MKVCFISHLSGRGGAERVLIEMISLLRKQNVECCAIVPNQGSLTAELKDRSVPFAIFPYRWWMHKRSTTEGRMGRFALNLAMILPVAWRIRRWKCDIVYTNTITICVGALAAKLLGCPHVWHIHEFGYEDHGLVFDLSQKFSLWLLDRFSHFCVANSQAVAQKYGQYLSAQKLKVLYSSPVLPDHPYSKKSSILKGEMRCVILGTLQEGKRQEDAILAIGDLFRRGKNIELLIVGDGDKTYRTHLQHLVSRHGLGQHIKFVGYVENPLPFLQQADVVIVPSKSEAFGRVTVEAMRVGKPVVGSKSGGTTELISHGFNGFLYTPGNYKELADHLEYLYEHRDSARKMGQSGQKWAAERFNEDRYGEELLSILKRLVPVSGP